MKTKSEKFRDFVERYPVIGLPVLVVLLMITATFLSGVAVLGYQDLQIISAPGNPASGYLRFSAQTGTLGCLTSSGGNCLAGVGSPLTTKGDLYTFGSANARLAVGTNTYCLTANSSAANGIDWEACAAAGGAAGGDLSGSYPNPTVIKINGTALSGLATGILKNTTSTGVPSIAAAADVYGLWSGSCGSTTYLSGSGACSTPAGSGTTVTIANGTSALGTGAIASGACASTVTTMASGVATTDDIIADFNASPLSTTGYSAAATGMLTIIKWPTSGNVNFAVCNNTALSITPGAVTLNWRVVR